MKYRTQIWTVVLAAVISLFSYSALIAKTADQPDSKIAETIAPDKQKMPEKPLAQIAIILDTSGSMSGMINQAKNQLWAIVNQFATAERDGVRPQLEVALYQYGSPSLGADNGFIRQLSPLTGDLDKIAEQLFRLRTDGGSEYCGWAIQNATQELKWSKSSRDYKAIFIAGNEPFSQGPVDFRKSSKDAITNGIIVNTIHCSGGADDDWKAAALLADGSFMRIETNQAVVEILTPFDEEIVRLNSELNDTYIGYGRGGVQSKSRQMAMDGASRSYGLANMSKRAITKSGKNYRAESWDLVDAVEAKGKSELKKAEDKDLPTEMQKMSLEEKEVYVEKKKTKRQELQKQIRELGKKRDAYVRDRQKELAGNENTLGNQIEEAVIKQSAEKGFSFKK